MSRWQRLRIEILKNMYALYMDSHTSSAEFEATDEHSLGELLREADYLVEKGYLRRKNGHYQLTAEGRDYVEVELPPKTNSPVKSVE